MSRYFTFAVLVGLAMMVAPLANADVTFQDDFESYADNAALTAAYDANTITGLVSSATYSRDLQSVANPHADVSGAVLNGHFPAINSNRNIITISYWMYDSAGQGPGATGSASLNGRAGLRFGSYANGVWGSGTLGNYVFMGAYHGVAGGPLYYATRVVTGGSGWQATTAPRSVGWQKFTIVLHKGVAKFYHNDGTTPVFTDTYAEPAAGWNCFSFGSPAGTTYVNAWYDDLKIEQARTYAGPYAGMLRVGSTSVEPGAGTSISYVLPYQADSAAVEILDATGNVAASFVGGSTGGLNTVTWDGSVDNAGGAQLPEATGYKVRVTVTNDAAPGWIVAATNSSTAPGTLFSGFSPNGFDAQTLQSSDNYGVILTRSSYNDATHPHAASLLLGPDLQPIAGGDGYADRVVRHPKDTTAPTNGAVWGGCFLPNSEVVFGCGQDTNWYFSCLATDTNALDANGGFVQLTFPRDVEVVDEGGQLWAYSCGSNSVIDKFKINAAGVAEATSINVLSPTSMGATLYSKDLEFDSAGNMYFLSRDGWLYRWSAAQVQAVTDAASAQVLGASAQWIVDSTTTLANRRFLGLEIVGDTVYIGAGNAATSTTFALYEVGKTSTTSLVKTLTSADVKLIGGRFVNGTYGALDADAVGNLLVNDRSTEYARLLTPGGSSVITVSAPTSQTFTIEASSVGDWKNY